LDKKEDPMQKAMAGGSGSSTDSLNKKKPSSIPKPKEALDFEKKIGKKKIKVIDGRTYN
jgi:hypothetical protein